MTTFLSPNDFSAEDRKTFERVTGLKLEDVLNTMQGTGQPEHYPDQAKLLDHMMNLKETPIQGAHRVTMGVLFIRDLMAPDEIAFAEEHAGGEGTPPEYKEFVRKALNEGKAVLVVVIGEVHTNPNKCQNKDLEMSRDVVLDIILPIVINVTSAVLIFESFFHLLKGIIDEMSRLLTRMKDNNFALYHVTECKESDVSCIYKDRSSALQFLRIFKTILHYLVLFGEKSLGKEEIQQTHIGHLNKRIYSMDPREDLHMANPFDTKNPPDSTAMAKSAQEFINGIHNYCIGHGMDKTPAWKKQYECHVFIPALELAQSIVNSPNISEYTKLFLLAPEVLSILYTMVVIEESILHDRERPPIFFFAGDTHRKQWIDGIKATGVFIVDVVDTHLSEGMGSCALPPKQDNAVQNNAPIKNNG